MPKSYLNRVALIPEDPYRVAMAAAITIIREAVDEIESLQDQKEEESNDA